MGFEKQESEAEERRLENKKIEDADKLLKEKAGDTAELATKAGNNLYADVKKDKEKDLAELAKKSGQETYSEIAKTRNGSEGSGNATELAEFEKNAKPFMDAYGTAISNANGIKDPEERKRTIEKAYSKLQEELGGVKGTQEGRDAQADKNRESDAKKTAEEKDRERTLKFSEAILKAAKEIEVDRRLAEIERRVKERAELSERTVREGQESAKMATLEIESNLA